jgi:hypothetical protein
LTAGFFTLLFLRPAAVSCPRLPNSCTEAKKTSLSHYFLIVSAESESGIQESVLFPRWIRGQFFSGSRGYWIWHIFREIILL